MNTSLPPDRVADGDPGEVVVLTDVDALTRLPGIRTGRLAGLPHQGRLAAGTPATLVARRVVPLRAAGHVVHVVGATVGILAFLPSWGQSCVPGS